MSGYFPTNNLCMPCANASAGCLTCSYNDGANGTLPYSSSLFACLTCDNTRNYFMNGVLCQLCTMSNCVTCLNLTACSICTSTYFPSVALTCVHCYVTGCAYCSTSNSNACAICNGTLGYYLSGTSCVTRCGDGIVVAGVEQCDDNNTANYDGCSSACAVDSSFTCTGAPSACYFAASLALSLSNTIIETAICDTITFTFLLTPASSTFAQNYINWTGFLVTPNTSVIAANNSMLVYSSGKLSASFFMRATIQNTTLVFTANFSGLTNSSIFSNTASNTLSFAVSPTNNRLALLECCVGYYYNATFDTCVEICGDGLLFVLPCDDGNLVNNDGCSSTCQVETDYVCTNGSANSSSVCCFNGSIAVSLGSAVKDPTSNSLALTYTIQPILPVLSLINGSYNFLPYVTLSNPEATVVSAVYDPASNTVNVQVAYNASIQNQPLDLTFNPPSVPTASLLKTVSNSWVVQPTNHLSAAYYPASTYDSVKKIQPYSSTVLGLYLSLCLVTLFFRKYIGLELATLIQMGYLSLVMNQQLPPYLQSVSAWQYVFGYNYFYLNGQVTTIDSSYAIYGYQKYFGYSCNVMVLAIASVYGVSLLLVCLSAVTAKGLSRKLQAGGFILLNEVGLALVTFSTPNILTAFFIEVQQGTVLDASIFWSKAFLCIGIAAVVVSNLINLVNIEDSSDVGTYYRKHSNLGIYASLFFSLRLVVLTALIFVSQVGSIASFFLISVQLLYLLFVVFGRPHKKPYDLVRAIIIESSLLYILLTRYLETSVLNSTVSQDSLLFSVLSVVELAAYGLGVTVSLVSLVYHLVKKFRKNKVEPNDNLLDEASPDKMKDSSLAKMDQDSKEILQESSPSKRVSNGANSNRIFDI
jgi:cysteine-rich repeat protein